MGNKWRVLIIEIREDIGAITPKVLSSTLRSLVDDGVVFREAFGEVPPGVECSLTDLGRSLLALAAELRRWAALNVAEIEDKRSRADAQLLTIAPKVVMNSRSWPATR